jgi:hypothetical protein
MIVSVRNLYLSLLQLVMLPRIGIALLSQFRISLLTFLRGRSLSWFVDPANVTQS